MLTLKELNPMPLIRGWQRRGFSALLASVDYRARGWYYASPLYDIIEHDDFIPKSLLMTPPILKKGEVSLGKELLKGQFTLLGQGLDMAKGVDWLPETLSDHWVDELHRFGWLKHLFALNTEQSLAQARALVSDWLDANGRYHPVTWKSEVLSSRLLHWLEHAEWLLQGADDSFVIDFMFAVNKHANLLPRRMGWHLGGWRLMRNIKALIYVGLCLPQRQGYALEGISLLKDQLRHQVRDDGGVIERSASVQLRVLDDLLEIHALLRKAGHTPATVLDDTIEQMVKALAVLRHPDESLAQFNLTDNDDAPHASALLRRCHTEQAPGTTFLPASGFVRLVQGHQVVLFDAGTTSHHVCPDEQQGGTLAFEYSIGQHRIFVNQGACVYKPHQQARARQTKSYSTVEINGESSTEILGLRAVGRTPAVVRAHVENQPGIGVGVEAGHDGYRHLGASHVRRIFLAEGQEDLRGEDVIEASRPCTVKAYFHLHPKVKVKLRQKYEAELHLPGVAPMVLKVRGGTLELIEGMYCPSYSDHRANQTLVLVGEWRQNRCTLRWGLISQKAEEGISS